jgi:hypothetical protein
LQWHQCRALDAGEEVRSARLEQEFPKKGSLVVDTVKALERST